MEMIQHKSALGRCSSTVAIYPLAMSAATAWIVALDRFKRFRRSFSPANMDDLPSSKVKNYGYVLAFLAEINLIDCNVTDCLEIE